MPQLICPLDPATKVTPSPQGLLYSYVSSERTPTIANIYGLGIYDTHDNIRLRKEN